MDNIGNLTKKEIILKIIEKKEFSQLPAKDVELAFEKFDKPKNAEYQKLKLTRNFLRKVYSSFSSRKLLNPKEFDKEYVLKKHKSTKERLEFYGEIYKRILSDEKTVIDLGAGVNGFSYDYFGKKVDYVATEAVGQLVDLMNFYFKKNKINGKAVHISLFDLKGTIQLIKKTKKPRLILLFKVIDSLEVMKRDYSKELLLELGKLGDKIVLSFPTRSLGKRQKFEAQRKWILNFIRYNFEVLDEFDFGGEKYLSFQKK